MTTKTGLPHAFPRLAAFATLLVGTALSPPGGRPAHAEGAVPTTLEECVAMLAGLPEGVQAALKGDCDSGDFGVAYRNAEAMRAAIRDEARPPPSSSSGGSGSCFLTTACCELVGLEDDCFELTVLRRYRDNVLPGLPGGKGEIALYYVLAPSILAGLRARRGEGQLFRLYFTHILPCVALALLGFGEATRRRYRDMLARLASAAVAATA